MIRRRVEYRGHVQGVGFRATAAALASNFEITGWVRNAPDGSVHLEVQGAPREIEAFLERLRQRMRANIRAEHAHDAPVEEGEYAFEIRR